MVEDAPMGSYQHPSARRGRPPTETGQLVTVRVHQPILDLLDDWITAQPDPKPSRQDVIRRFLVEGISRHQSAVRLSGREIDPPSM
jgi:hypothetical protein